MLKMKSETTAKRYLSEIKKRAKYPSNSFTETKDSIMFFLFVQ
jgi:hypothetical protein